MDGCTNEERKRFESYITFKNYLIWACCGGQVVSVLAFYSDDPSLNHAKPTVFSVKFVFEKIEKGAGVGPF